MDFSNWPSPQPSQSTTSNFFGDFSFNSPLNSTSSTTSLPTTSISNLLSFADDDFEEFSEPTPSKNSTFDFNFSQAASPLNNSKNLDDDDFDFDFTPGKKVQAPSMIQKLENGETKTGKQARNTFILPISDSSPTSPAVTPKHSTHHIVHNSPIPSYNPFGSPTPLNQPKSEPVPNYNPFGSPIASNPEQAASSSTSFPLSPLGSLGDILDKDERGELDRNRVASVIVQQQATPSRLVQSHSIAERKTESLLSNPVNASEVKKPTGGKPKTMEIEWTDENSFLCIIDQPKVEKSGFSKIPSFRISTKVVKPHPFLKEQFYQVRRTVYDIEFLHKHLAASHQFLILPPLPHKKEFSKSVLGDAEGETSNQQCKLYQNFMTRLGRHPVFSKLSDVSDFLTKTPEEYEAKRKAKYEYPQNYPPAATGGWFSSSTPTLKDEKLVLIYKQINGFKEYLKPLQVSAETIRKRYIDLNNAYASFAEELKKMPMNSLIKPESGVTFHSSFNSSFDSFIIAFDDTSKKMTIQSRLNENLLDERIETWVLYCGSACEAIERFSTLELALKEVQQSMERREERLNVLKKTLSSKTGTSSAEDQKLIDLTEAFEKAESNYKSLSTLYNSTKSALYTEIQQFDKYKLNEINTWIEYYGECQYTQLLYLTKSWSFYAPK